MQEMQVQSLDWEDPLEKDLATHSGKFQGQRSLAGYSPWVAESQWWLSHWTHTHILGPGKVQAQSQALTSGTSSLCDKYCASNVNKMLFGYWCFQAQAEPAPKKTESWGLQSGQTVLQSPCPVMTLVTWWLSPRTALPGVCSGERVQQTLQALRPVESSWLPPADLEESIWL